MLVNSSLYQSSTWLTIHQNFVDKGCLFRDGECHLGIVCREALTAGMNQNLIKQTPGHIEMHNGGLGQ